MEAMVTITKSKEKEILARHEDGRVKIACDRFKCGQPIWIREYMLGKRDTFCPECWEVIYFYKNHRSYLGDHRPDSYEIQQQIQDYLKTDQSLAWINFVIMTDDNKK